MKTLSLFSGAGGLDIGFHRAGFDIIGCVEIEKQYCETLKTNRDNGKYFNPEAKIYCEDIRSFKPEEFVNKNRVCYWWSTLSAFLGSWKEIGRCARNAR